MKSPELIFDSIDQDFEESKESYIAPRDIPDIHYITSPELESFFYNSPEKLSELGNSIAEFINIKDRNTSLKESFAIGTAQFFLLHRKIEDNFGKYEHIRPSVYRVEFNGNQFFLKISPLVYHSGGFKEMIANEEFRSDLAENNIKGVRAAPALWSTRIGDHEAVLYPFDPKIDQFSKRVSYRERGPLVPLEDAMNNPRAVWQWQDKVNITNAAVDLHDRVYLMFKAVGGEDKYFDVREPTETGSVITPNFLYDTDTDEIVVMDINYRWTEFIDRGQKRGFVGYVDAVKEFRKKLADRIKALAETGARDTISNK